MTVIARLISGTGEPLNQTNQSKPTLTASLTCTSLISHWHLSIMAKLKTSPSLPEMEKELGYSVGSMAFAGTERFYSDLKPVPNDKLKQFLREYQELTRRDHRMCHILPKSGQDLVGMLSRPPPPGIFENSLTLIRPSRAMDAASSSRRQTA